DQEVPRPLHDLMEGHGLGYAHGSVWGRMISQRPNMGKSSLHPTMSHYDATMGRRTGPNNAKTTKTKARLCFIFPKIHQEKPGNPLLDPVGRDIGDPFLGLDRLDFNE